MAPGKMYGMFNQYPETLQNEHRAAQKRGIIKTVVHAAALTAITLALAIPVFTNAGDTVLRQKEVNVSGWKHSEIEAELDRRTAQSQSPVCTCHETDIPLQQVGNVDYQPSLFVKFYEAVRDDCKNMCDIPEDEKDDLQKSMCEERRGIKPLCQTELEDNVEAMLNIFNVSGLDVVSAEVDELLATTFSSPQFMSVAQLKNREADFKDRILSRSSKQALQVATFSSSVRAFDAVPGWAQSWASSAFRTIEVSEAVKTSTPTITCSAGTRGGGGMCDCRSADFWDALTWTSPQCNEGMAFASLPGSPECVGNLEGNRKERKDGSWCWGERRDVSCPCDGGKGESTEYDCWGPNSVYNGVRTFKHGDPKCSHERQLVSIQKPSCVESYMPVTLLASIVDLCKDQFLAAKSVEEVKVLELDTSLQACSKFDETLTRPRRYYCMSDFASWVQTNVCCHYQRARELWYQRQFQKVGGCSTSFFNPFEELRTAWINATSLKVSLNLEEYVKACDPQIIQYVEETKKTTHDLFVELSAIIGGSLGIVAIVMKPLCQAIDFHFKDKGNEAQEASSKDTEDSLQKVDSEKEGESSLRQANEDLKQKMNELEITRKEGELSLRQAIEDLKEKMKELETSL